MSAVRVQAISGVSSQTEGRIQTTYPSIASTDLGRALGRLYNSIPIGVGVVKLSHVLFTLLVIPPLLAILIYFFLKAAGLRFVLTNRSVQKWKSVGDRLLQEVALGDIAEIALEQLPGQEFFRACDLVLLDASQRTLMRLEGVRDGAVLRQTILQARDARRQVDASMAAIRARHTG